MDFGFWFLLLAFILVALAVAWAVGFSIVGAAILTREAWADSTKRIKDKTQQY